MRSSLKPTICQKLLLQKLRTFGGPFCVDLSRCVAYVPWDSYRVDFQKVTFWGLIDRGLIVEHGAAEYKIDHKRAKELEA